MKLQFFLSEFRKWHILKKAVIYLVALAMIICLLYCISPFREAFWEMRVKSYVLTHQRSLNQFAESFPINEPMENLKYHGWEVISYPVHEYGNFSYSAYAYSSEGNSYIIEFDCYGWGIVPSSSYAGMYYSPTNTAVGFQGISIDSLTSAQERHETSLVYETKKICDNWFWYIARF